MSTLSQIRSLATVDVDSMDPDVAMRQSEISEKFCDMTSNQAIVYFQATKDHSFVKKTIELLRTESSGWYQDPANHDRDLQDAVDVLVRKILIHNL
jgi:transaldolase